MTNIKICRNSVCTANSVDSMDPPRIDTLLWKNSVLSKLKKFNKHEKRKFSVSFSILYEWKYSRIDQVKFVEDSL